MFFHHQITMQASAAAATAAFTQIFQLLLLGLLNQEHRWFREIDGIYTWLVLSLTFQSPPSSWLRNNTFPPNVYIFIYGILFDKSILMNVFHIIYAKWKVRGVSCSCVISISVYVRICIRWILDWLSWKWYIFWILRVQVKILDFHFPWFWWQSSSTRLSYSLWWWWFVGF